LNKRKVDRGFLSVVYPLNIYSLLLTRIIPTTIKTTPATILTYFKTFEAFLIKIKRKLIKIDIIINGMASPAE
jgi:hypothetical protein